MLNKKNNLLNKFFSELKIEKRKKDLNADPDCVMCKGYGSYKTIHCGEYEEHLMESTCGCKNRIKKEKEIKDES